MPHTPFPLPDMSVVALQVGQAGCQGGAALFDLLAAEAGLAPGAGAHGGGQPWSEAADRFFYLASAGGQTRWDLKATGCWLTVLDSANAAPPFVCLVVVSHASGCSACCCRHW